MTTTIHLPGPDDGAEGLLELAKVFGDAAVFNLIRLCRTTGGGNDPGGEALTALANQMIAAHRDAHPELSIQQARAAVADNLGYTKPGQGNGRSNFLNISRGGRPRNR